MTYPTVPATPPNQAAPIAGQRQTYAAAITGLVPAAACTDLFNLIGSATKTIEVTRIEFTATTTAVTGILDVVLVKRSTASTTAGVSTGSPTATSYDSTNAASTAVAKGWTTCNTSLGTLVGTAIRSAKYMCQLAASTATDFPSQEVLSWTFGDRPCQALTLRGIAEQIAINLNGGTIPAGCLCDISVEWTER